MMSLSQREHPALLNSSYRIFRNMSIGVVNVFLCVLLGANFFVLDGFSQSAQHIQLEGECRVKLNSTNNNWGRVGNYQTAYDELKFLFWEEDSECFQTSIREQALKDLKRYRELAEVVDDLVTPSVINDTLLVYVDPPDQDTELERLRDEIRRLMIVINNLNLEIESLDSTIDELEFTLALEIQRGEFLERINQIFAQLFDQQQVGPKPPQPLETTLAVLIREPPPDPEPPNRKPNWGLIAGVGGATVAAGVLVATLSGSGDSGLGTPPAFPTRD